MQKYLKCAVSSLALLVMFVVSASAQVTGGAVTGNVVDPNGAVVRGATVVLKDKSRGQEFTATTTDAGNYQFPNVPTGTYTMTVTAGGFGQATGEVTVSLNQTATANVALTVAGSSAVVDVTSDTEAIVQTETSQVGATFKEREFKDLPVGGNPNNLALLAPQVVSPPIGVSGEGAITGGLRQRANGFTVDGVDNTDVGVSGSVRGVIADSVSEFSFLQNNFNAEFSSAGAGQFNTITKSGTNQYHGSVFSYFDSQRFNARSTDEDGGPKRFNKNVRYGGTFGGPLPFLNFGELDKDVPLFNSGKDKLFFFAAFERDFFVGEGSSSGYIAPTEAGLNAIAARPGASQYVINLLRSAMPLAPTNEFDNCDEDFGPGPILGACGIGMGNVNVPLPNTNGTKSFQMNVDHNLNAKNQFRYRFYKTKFTQEDGVLVPLFAADTSVDQTSFSANWVGNLSPNIVNDFRFGYFTSETIFSRLRDQAQFDFPTLDLDDFSISLGPSDQQTDSKKVHQFYDSVTWIAGKHAFKFGGEWLKRDNSIFFLPRHAGQYSYSDLDDFFLDLKPLDFNHIGIGDPIQPLASNQYGAFFQDDWKITQNLTLNLGVRWDFQSIFEVEKLQELSAPANIPGVIEFRVPKADKNNFGPRLGFAWAPHFDNTIGRFFFGNEGESSIRANFARTFFNTFSNLVSAGPPAALQGELVDAGPATAFLQSGGATTGLPPYVFNNSPQNIRNVTGSLILDHVSPYADSFAVSYQRQLGKSMGLEVRYLRTQGKSLFVQVQTNSRTVADASMVIPTLFSLPTAAELATRPTIGTVVAADPVLNGATQAPRQLPTFAGVLTSNPPVGKSRYNGLSVSVNRRFANNFSASAAYTWSSTWDNSFNELFTSSLNPRRSQDAGEWFGAGLDLSADWSKSIADIPHRFVASAVYELPFKSENAFVNAVVGGWVVTGIFQTQSGQLVDIQSGIDSNRNGDNAGDRALFNPNGDINVGSNIVGLTLVNGVVTQVPVGSAPDTAVRAYLAVNPNAAWIKTGYFAAELKNGGAGTAPRNAYRTKSWNNTDMVFIKNTRFGHEGRYNFQIAAEAHDVFNQRAVTIRGIGSGARSFTLPDTQAFLNYSTDFGVYPGRTVQLRGKFIF
jgi:outer membrane receptor protein involved in Fe transport